MASSITRPMALLVTIPIFFSLLVGATPKPTPAAVLDKRANGANIIGFSISGTSTRTRSCNTGYFSTSGALGNCCVDNSCNFLTACVGSTIYYANGDVSTCASSTCGAGTVYLTAGDQSPLTMYNCQSNWVVTETLSATAGGTTTTKSASASSAAASASSSKSSSSSTNDVSAAGAGASATASNTGSTASSTSSGATAAQASNTATSSTTETQSKGSSSNAGAIAGGVVGGLAVLAIVAGVVGFLIWKRNKKAKEGPSTVDATAPPSSQTPAPQMANTQYVPPAGYAGAGNGGYQAYNPNMNHGYSQDYKVAPVGQFGHEGGYAQEVGGTPIQTGAPAAPAELSGPNVTRPVEMPAQTGYGR